MKTNMVDAILIVTVFISPNAILSGATWATDETKSVPLPKVISPPHILTGSAR